MALPELRTIDYAQPIQNYVAGQQAQRKGKLAELEYGQKQRESTFADYDRLKNETMGEIAMLDPDAPDFQNQKFKALDRIGQNAVNMGISPDVVRAHMERSIGGLTPDNVRVMQEKNGLRRPAEKPLRQIIDGQYVTVGEEGPSSTPIPGFKKEEKPPAPGMVKGEDGRWKFDEAYMAGKRELAAAGKSSVSVTNKIGNERQSAVVEPLLKALPKNYETAVADKSAIERLDQALAVVKKGGNSVTGLSGAIKAGLAPYATAIGMNTESMNDAQILQTLLDAGAGSLRMEVVGPGPVSNFEQQILQKVSGRKMSAAEGVKTILEYHKKGKVAKVEAMNKQLESISAIDGYQDTTSIYPKIALPGNQQSIPKGATHSGINPKTGKMEYFDQAGRKL